MKKYQKRPTLGVRSGTIRLEGGGGEKDGARIEEGGREGDSEVCNHHTPHWAHSPSAAHMTPCVACRKSQEPVKW